MSADENVHTGKHRATCVECHVFRRRVTIQVRALHNPGGLTPYEYTKGMTKADSLAFWVDAKALGLITVGMSSRGALIALPSYKVPA